jgi:hypothetical protein
MADDQVAGDAPGAATSGPKPGDVAQLAQNAKWNAEHGNPDAAKREAAVVRMVTRKRQ